MNPFILIPARGGSKGIPRKNIMNFCGLPLIAWSINQGLSTGLPVYVSTEDDEIARCAKEFKGNVIDRPRELAEDNSCMRDVIIHALEVNKDYDTVILLQSTSPLRINSQIIYELGFFKWSKKVYAFSCYSTVLKEWKLTTYPEQFINRQNASCKLIEHGMLYIYNRNSWPLATEDIISQKNINAIITPRWQSFELDEPDDVDICEFYMRKYICSQKV